MDQILSDYKSGKLSIDEVLMHLRQQRAQAARRPLSEGQRGLWWLQKMSPDSTGYHIPLALRFRRAIDADWVQRALDALMAEHPALTSAFVETDGQPSQIEGTFLSVPLQREDLGAMSDEVMLRELKSQIAKPMQLDREPLVRAWLYKRDSGERVLLLVIHHLVCDGRSVHLLLSGLLKHLRGQLAGLPPVVGTEQAAYADFVTWQQAFVDSDAGRAQLAYWQQQLLAPLPVLEMPTDQPRHASSRTAGRTHSEQVGPQLAGALRQLARTQNLTPAVLMLGAYKLLLSRYCGQDDVIVGMPTMGRPDERFESSVGYFVNMVPVRSRVVGEQSLPTFLQNLQLTLVDALDHSAYPFSALVRQLRVPRSNEHPPVFQVAFEYLNGSVLQSGELSAAGGADLACEALPGLHQEGEYELTLEVHEQAADFDLHFKYDPELYDAITIQQMARHYLTLLSGITQSPDRPLQAYSLLSDAELQTMLRGWNATQIDYPDRCLHQLFAEQAQRTPEAIALRYEDEALSYRELDQRTDTLARYLQVQGIGPDSLVGVCLDRSIDMVVSLLGVLRAGGAYVPLDPHYPVDRLQYMLADCGASLLLTNETQAKRLNAALPSAMKVALVDDWTAVMQLAACLAHRIDVVTPAHLAYVIYTSGSTGRPKGVMIEHRSLTNFLLAMSRRPGLCADDRLLAVTTYSFDIAGLELFLPLIVGAQCCVVGTSRTRDAAQLRAEIDRLQPTVMQATPVTWALLFQSGWRNEGRIKALCGGEPLPQQLKQSFADSATPAWNMFGPTETTIWSTVGEIRADEPTTIGRAIANTSVYILDERLQPVPVGVAGELHIGGHGLARGYLNRPELTAEKFIDNPFEPGSRLYKTGDLARWRADGQIEHLGRIDTQIKLRGYRIELGEIETVLARHARVGHCAVVLHESPDRKQLVAYYVPQGELSEVEAASAAQEFRTHLRAHLPEFMVPNRFVALQALPLSPAGKIDRQGLSKRDPNEGCEAAEKIDAEAKIKTSATEVAEPEAHDGVRTLLTRADVQDRVLQIWRDGLGNPRAGLDEGFFDGGGDSLLASTVAQRIATGLGCEFAVTDLFKHGTVRQISAHLSTVLGARSDAAVGKPAPSTVSRSKPTGARTSRAAQPQARGPSGDGLDDSLAIIGLSCQFPGAADHRAFWSNLRDGVESVRFFSGDELRLQGVDDDLIRNPAYIAIQSSIEGKELFDPAFFKVSPRDAELMDPQARLLLQNAWKALEDAGYVAADMPDTGVFMALSNSRYNVPEPTHGAPYVMRRTEEYLSWVLSQGGTVPTLVSHKLGLKGPSYSVHSNCSSSLVALNAAFQAIRSGDARAALVGAATVFPGDSMGYVHQPGMNFSADGHVRAFDAAANGMIAGEGVAVMLVKRASDALADGDHIYAVIRGLALNNDGADKAGFYAPSVLGQGAVIDKVLQATGIHPETISYVEAHGTGTSLGDPIEFAALREVYTRHTGETGFCGLGSVKTNLGHLDTAAGLAGCIKVALSLEHGELPPTLNYSKPNPGIALDGSPFYINDQLKDWPPTAGPRRAALSSFGIGGTNGHAILEQAPLRPVQADEPDADAISVVPLSARNAERLQAQAQNLLAFLQRPDQGLGSLRSLAYTLQVGREAMQQRVVFVVSSRSELIERLQAFCSGQQQVPGCVRGEVSSVAPLGDWFDGDDSATLLDRWLSERAMHKLARAWASGLRIEWRRMYGEALPTRVSLPTYPFAPERYRLPARVATVAAGESVTAQLHPLVHRNTSHLGQQRFTSTLTGNEFFLRDHVVQAQRVLPGVAYLEMARAAVELSVDPSWLDSTLPDDGAGPLAITLENVVFARPLAVAGTPVDLRISLESDDDGIGFQIASHAGSAHVLHSQGRAILSRPGAADQIADWVGEPHAEGVRQFSSEACYAAFGSLGFAYGPAFQVLHRVWVHAGDMGLPVVQAQLQLPAAMASTLSTYVLHPSLLDGALQACVGLLLSAAADAEVKPALPFAIERVEILRPLPADAQVLVRFAEGSRPDASVRKLDLEIADFDGVVCARLLGYSSRVLNAPSKASVSAERLYLQPHWAPEPLSAEPAALAVEQQIVVICEAGLGADYGEHVGQHLQELNAAAAPALSALTTRVLNWQDGQGSQADRYTRHASRLLALVKEIAASRPGGKVLIQLVVPVAGDDAVLDGLYALLKSAAQENPKLVPQVLAVETPCLPHELARWLDGEARDPVSKALRYNSGTRQLLKLEPVADASATDLIWKDQGVYLVTGGLGGLGRLVAGDIAQHVADARLVLTGRSALNASAQAWLQSLRRQGHRVDYRELDVCDAGQVGVLIDEIVAMHGRLDGVVHAAGTLRDGLLTKKTEADLRAVLGPKVSGLVALDEATASLDLDCFILFSSVSVLAGNVGQTDYAAANAFMDAFAQQRSEQVRAGRRSGRTLSINWPLWAEGGMQVDELVRERLRRATGMVPLESSAGLQALHTAYALPGAQVVVLNGDLARLMAGPASDQAASPVAASSTVAAPASRPAQALAAASLVKPSAAESSDLKSAAVSYVRGLIAAGLKLPPDRPLDADAPLDQYGIDSIMVTELTGRLESVFGSLPKTLFFEYQTAAELAGYLLESHRDTLAQVVGAASSASSAGASPSRAVKPLVAAAEASSASRAVAVPRRGAGSPVQAAKTASGAVGASAAGSSDRVGPQPLDIAIIGVAGRYPKARNLDELWSNLTQGVDCITEVPPERWSLDGFFDAQRGRLGRSYTKWGGFIDGMDEFDPAFFGMTDLDAQIMDPQERLFLQCVHDTLEDAGYTRETIVKQHQALGLLGNVGVFVGTMYMEYQLHAAQAQERGEGFGLNGLAASMANRVSYAFNFHGPSLAVDAMCSASLTAIHLASHSLLRGECEVAVAGGVNLNLHPNKFLVMSQGQFASSEGLCRSFGDGGDGYVASEGVGAVLLKPLDRAIADGDQIYAVIKGSALSHSGKTSAYTVPNPNAQAQAIRQAVIESSVPAQAVSYIEAHGTGTVLGDPIEIAALARVYGGAARGNRPLCPIGSVKSNLGHCESAGGMAGLTKVLLQMRHRKLVPSLHSRTLNGNIDFDRAPFHVQQELADWERPVDVVDGREHVWPLTAGVSSYGAGGSNAHLIVQEFIDDRDWPALDTGGKHALVLSARTQQALREAAQRLLQSLQAGLFDDQQLGDVAYTLQVGREAMDYRLAFLAQSVAEASAALEAYLNPTSETAGLFVQGSVSSGRESLGVLHADGDLQDVMQAWGRGGKLDKLIQLWVKGVAFDWSSLYGMARPRRVSLPTYPFARSRFWMPKLSKQDISQGLLVEGGAEIGAGTVQHVMNQKHRESGGQPEGFPDDEPSLLSTNS